MRAALLSLALLLVSCADVSGTEAGDACNAQGVCVPGLLCEEGRCKDLDDVQWERMNRPDEENLRAVFGTAPDNLFAVGNHGTILRYQGQGLDWVDAKPSLEIKGDLLDIWGRPGSIWAVGEKAILRWDGASWSEQQAYDTENNLIEDLYLNGIHGAGDRVYAVGGRSYPPYDKLVLRHDATTGRWNQVKLDLAFTPLDLWVTADGQVFVVGDALHVKHFNGSTWSEQNLDATSAVALRAIWGTADGTTLYAVGESGVLATYQGGTWTVADKGRLPFKAYDLAGRAAADLFVVGTPGYNSSDTRSGIERCATFCTYNPLAKEVRGEDLYGVWIADDGGTVVAVGQEGTILRRVLQ